MGQGMRVVGLSFVVLACGGARTVPEAERSEPVSPAPTTAARAADPPPTETAPSTPTTRSADPGIRIARSACATDADCVVARVVCCPGCCEDGSLTAFSRTDLERAREMCARERCPRLHCGAEDCPPPSSRTGTAACVDGTCIGVTVVGE